MIEFQASILFSIYKREGEKSNFLLGIAAAWRQFTLCIINSAK